MSKMINVRLITNAGAKMKTVMDSTTLRQLYEQNGVNYQACVNTVDSVPVNLGDFDKALVDLVGPNAEAIRVSSIVKQDNAAKIIIVGNAAIIKSAVKLEDWKKVLKYDPETGLYNEDGEPVFCSGVQDNDMGSLTRHGVVWSGTPDEEGYAVATLMLSPGTEDRKETVRETIGSYLLDLNELEKSIPEALEEAEACMKEIDDSIVLM